MLIIVNNNKLLTWCIINVKIIYQKQQSYDFQLNLLYDPQEKELYRYLMIPVV